MLCGRYTAAVRVSARLDANTDIHIFIRRERDRERERERDTKGDGAWLHVKGMRETRSEVERSLSRQQQQQKQINLNAGLPIDVSQLVANAHLVVSPCCLVRSRRRPSSSCRLWTQQTAVAKQLFLWSKDKRQYR